MDNAATLQLEDKTYTFPVFEGSEGEKAIDTRKLRAQTGYIAFDDGYGNTGSCKSDITFIDGEKGILRYRGYPIEQLAGNCDFLSAAHLIMYGELPNAELREAYGMRVRKHSSLHRKMNYYFFEGYPSNSHPMAVLSAALNSLGCYCPEMASNNRAQDLEHFDDAAASLISKVRTIAAQTYRMKMGYPATHPREDYSYVANFLHMMFSQPHKAYVPRDEVESALDMILLLHADHEQNCSTSTVRMVASGGANLFASVSAGVCALWGPLHGGANMAVIKMLEEINASGDDGSKFIEAAKTGEKRLMGFGHRVYKNFDPRAKILGEAAEKVLGNLGVNDPLLNIARRLADTALSDSYFVDRKLYPNVDFYSGIILKAIGIPLDMFTVIFAMGRMPGWIANWKEIAEDPNGRIHRPRQIYTGPVGRELKKD